MSELNIMDSGCLYISFSSLRWRTANYDRKHCIPCGGSKNKIPSVSGCHIRRNTSVYLFKCICKKKSFDDFISANKRIAEIREDEFISVKKPVRSFECPFCGKYHISSIPESEFSKYKEFLRKKDQEWIKQEANHWYKKFGIEK